MELLKKLFTPYKTKYNKIRYGKNSDGGYVLLDLNDVQTDVILSFGIDNEYSFDEDIANRLQKPVLMYDGSCDVSPTNTLLTFNKAFLTPQNVNEIFKDKTNITVKMDIEFWEYPVFNAISVDNLNNINQLVVEYHYIHQPVPERVAAFIKMNEFFRVVHVHANNGSPLFNNVPTVLEVTYLHRKIENTYDVDYSDYPIEGLDFPNVSGADLQLNYWK